MVDDRLKRVAINEVAGVLRNQADRDYICARHIYVLGFADQFMWQVQQALEKYLKSAILYLSALPHEGGIGIRPLGMGGYGHKLPELLADLKKIEPWRPGIPPSVDQYVKHVYRMGLNRYGDRHAYQIGDEMPRLDEAVWHLRRWCKYCSRLPPSNFPAKITPEQWIRTNRNSILRAKPGSHQLVGGLLESLIDKQGGGLWRHARAALLRWNRWFYKTRPSDVAAPRWGSSSVPVWDRDWAKHRDIIKLLTEIGAGP